MADTLTKSEMIEIFDNSQLMSKFGGYFAEGFKKATKELTAEEIAAAKKLGNASDKLSKSSDDQSKSSDTFGAAAALSLRSKKAEALINQDLWAYVKEFGVQINDNNFAEQSVMANKLWENAQESFNYFEDFQHRTISEAKAHLGKLGLTVNSLNDVMEFQSTLMELRSDSVEKRAKALESINKQLGTSYKSAAIASKKLTKTFGVMTANIINKGEPAVSSLSRKFRKGVESFSTLDTAVIAAGKAVTQMRNDIKMQLKVGSVYQANAGLFDRYWRALKMGVDPGAFAEMNAETRRVALASGSLSGFMDMLGNQHREAFNVIGDTTEATRFLGGMYATLGKRGIKPAGKSLQSLTQSFAYMQKVTGMTADQFRGHLDDMMDDENVMLKLRTATNEKDRQQIINNTMARMKENVAIGMTVDQAKETTKALHRLAGEDPRERFKKGAKLQAAMGAMGVSGGADANRLMQLGMRRTKEQNAELQGYLTKTSEAMTATRTGDNIGAEFMAAGILDKTGMQDVLGPSSPFQMQFKDSLAVQKGMEASLNTLKDQVGILTGAAYFGDIFTSALASSPLAAIGSSLLSLVGWFMKGPFLIGLAMAMGKSSAVGAAATATATAIPTLMRGALPALGAMLPALGAMVVPAAIAAVVGGVGYLGYKALTGGSGSDSSGQQAATEQMTTLEIDAFDRLQMTMQDVASNTLATVQILNRLASTTEHAFNFNKENEAQKTAMTKSNNKMVAQGASVTPNSSNKPTG